MDGYVDADEYCLNDDLYSPKQDKTVSITDRLVAIADFRYYIPFAKIPKSVIEKMADSPDVQFLGASVSGAYASAVFRHATYADLLFYVFRKNGSSIFSVIVTGLQKGVSFRFV